MMDYQANIDRYLKVMRLGYGIWTVIWTGFLVAIIVFAADFGSAVGLSSIWAALYIWIYVLYRRNVKQAVEKYRQQSE